MFANTRVSHTQSPISFKNNAFRIQIRKDQISRLLDERRKKFQQEVQQQEKNEMEILINGQTTMKVYRQIFEKIDMFIIQIEKWNCDFKVIEQMIRLLQAERQAVSIFLDWRICEMVDKNQCFKNQFKVKLKENQIGLVLDILGKVYLNRMSLASAEWLCFILLKVVDEWRFTLWKQLQMSNVRKMLDCLSMLLKNKNGTKVREMLLNYDFGWMIQYASGEFDNLVDDVHSSVINLVFILAISTECSKNNAGLSTYLIKYLNSHFDSSRALSIQLLHISATHNHHIDIQVSYHFFINLLQFTLSQQRSLNVVALNMVYCSIKTNKGLIRQLVDKEGLLEILQERILRQYEYHTSDLNVIFCLGICCKILGLILCGYSPKKSIYSHSIFKTICQKTQQFPHTAVLLEIFQLFWEFFVPRADDALLQYFLSAASCFPLDHLEFIEVMKAVTRIFECLMKDEGNEKSEQILELFEKNGLIKYFEYMQ